MSNSVEQPVIPIYTIGYGERSIAEFIAALQRYQIAYLIDVRSVPYSRFKPEFSKAPLAEALRQEGIRYLFMGDTLGGRPDDPDCYTAGAVDYEKVKTMATYQQGISRVQKAFAQQQRVALMCSEGKPEHCHRSRLIGATLTQLAIPVIHIDEADAAQTQAAVLQRLTGDQLALPLAAGPEPARTPLQVLKTVFGYDEFRPYQEAIISNVLQRRDTLVIMPTGGGKSLCYQLPALLFPGLTVVVSPLIALMQDQVEQLRELGVSAVFLNSSLIHADYVATTNQVRQGAVKLLYVAPETLLRPETLLLLEQAQVNCLAIDEAHCISQWGHDFRPEYRQLAPLRQRFAQTVCVALTATATPRVQADIKQSLQLRDENSFVTSFDRPNLFISVAPKINTLQQTLDFLAIHPNQSGIIYCATRQQVDDLTTTLTAQQIRCLPYHAGLDDATRQRNQNAFIRDDVPLMVATIAFGMGIDKPDVRFILHVDLPKEMESYYQQIGRAGRDGLRADCLLLFSRGDVRTIMHFIEQGAASEQRERTLRLQAFVGWAESDRCRRHQLLAYFGESYVADNCQMCDNCLHPEQERVDLTLPAQKFLSCVLRTRETYGVNYIIQILRGSQAQEILQRGHEKLSTYGVGQEFSAETWKHLARQFLQQGLLEQDMQIGSLKLTAKGRDVLKGEPVWGTLAAVTTASTQLEPISYDLGLFAQLRTRRKELADQAQVPPYAIFPDRSLQEMATYFPQSAAALARLHGVGEVKLARYADLFLPLIRAYCQEHGLNERAKSNQPMARRQAVGKARWEEVGEAFVAGESIAALMELYNVKRQTVIQNLSRFAEAGQPLPVDRLRSESQLAPEWQDRVLTTLAELGPERLGPVFAALQEAVSYDELHLLRMVYWAEANNR